MDHSVTKDTKNLKFCYIGGGSRNWAWVLMKDLAFEKELEGTVCLYDINAEAARANEELGSMVMAEHNPGRWKFATETDLGRALEGSDFVFISILPGGFEEMAVDVHLPEKYGIYQSVGDTIGAGGLSRALRVIPDYEAIARAIAQYAPDAWVFNYTNPMTICTRTLYKVFPKIKAFGCCHEVFGTQKLLVKLLVKSGLAKEGEISRKDLTTNVVGINHFTWLDRASWKERSLFPLYADFAREFAEGGFSEGKDENWLNDHFAAGNRIKFDLFLRFGLIAAAGDRHLAEFCPPSWYLKNPQTVKDWQFAMTPVSWRMEQREKLKGKSAAYRSGKEKFTPEHSGEEGLAIIRALLGLENLVTNVNLPNKGQMPGLPADAVVETNAFFSRDSVSPVFTEGVPNPLGSLMLQHVTNQVGIIEAALARDLEAAFLVFMNDPQVRPLSRDNARALFREMTARTLSPGAGYKTL
jgi:alpha-galactosidase